jgi:hypothetical protein
MLGIAVGSWKHQRTCKLETISQSIVRLTAYELQCTWLAGNVDWDGVAWNSPCAEGSWSDKPNAASFSSSINVPEERWTGEVYLRHQAD